MQIYDPKCSWRDGRLYSDAFDDIYFSTGDGLAETEYVFIEQSGFLKKVQTQQRVVVGETGFGTGLNFLATWSAWEKHATAESELHYVSIEKYPLAAFDIQKALSAWPQLAPQLHELLANYPVRRAGIYRISLAEGRVQLTLCFGDVLEVLEQLIISCDVWYLDGFSPQHNQDMWSEKVFALLAKHSAVNARLSTFTVAGFVRRGLQAQGFTVERAPGFGMKREMLTATFEQVIAPNPKEPWFQLPVQDLAGKTPIKKVAIIGAGLAGCSAAYLCAQAGMQVDLYDEHGVATAASGNPIGLCAPNLSADESPFAHYYFSAWQYATQTFRQLQATHQELFFEQLGTKHCLFNSYEHQRAERIIQQCCALDAWAAIETATPFSYLSIPEVAHVVPQALCQLYSSHKLISQQRQDVDRFVYENGVWNLYAVDNTKLGDAQAVIIANAQAALSFTQAQDLNLQSVRGQLAYLEQPLGAIQNALQGETYITAPWRQHQIVGATFQRDDMETELRQADQEWMWQQCADSLGIQLPAQKLQGRVSFRSCGPDRMPVVGHLMNAAAFSKDFADLRYGKPAEKYPPARYEPHCYVSLGHGSRGIVGALLAARIIVDQMQGMPLACSYETWKAICPQRFLVRQLKRITT